MIDFDYFKTINGSKSFSTKKEYELNSMVNSLNKFYDNVIDEFDILIKSNRADIVKINGIEKRVLIDYNSTFTIAQLEKDVNTIQAYANDFQIGDYIESNRYTNKDEVITYLLNQKKSMRNNYELGYMKKCNNVITFKNSSNDTIVLPIILSDNTLYSDGVDAQKLLTVMDDMRSIFVQYNDDTKSLFIQERLIFNNNSVYSVTKIDDYTYFYNKDGKDIGKGILKLTLKRDQFVKQDDKANNLAYQTYGDNMSETPVGNVTINGSKILKVGSTGTWNIQLDDGSAVSDNYTFTVSDTNKVNIVSQDGKSIVLKGLFYGEVKITATNVNDNTKSCWKVISVQNGW